MEVTEVTTEQPAVAPEAEAAVPEQKNVTIHLREGIAFDATGEYTDRLTYTGDETIQQDPFGVSVKFTDGRVLWVPTANIAGITTEPRV